MWCELCGEYESVEEMVVEGERFQVCEDCFMFHSEDAYPEEEYCYDKEYK